MLICLQSNTSLCFLFFFGTQVIGMTQLGCTKDLRTAPFCIKHCISTLFGSNMLIGSSTIGRGTPFCTQSIMVLFAPIRFHASTFKDLMLKYLTLITPAVCFFYTSCILKWHLVLLSLTHLFYILHLTSYITLFLNCCLI